MKVKTCFIGGAKWTFWSFNEGQSGHFTFFFFFKKKKIKPPTRGGHVVFQSHPLPSSIFFSFFSARTQPCHCISRWNAGQGSCHLPTSSSSLFLPHRLSFSLSASLYLSHFVALSLSWAFTYGHPRTSWQWVPPASHMAADGSGDPEMLWPELVGGETAAMAS